MSISRNQTTTPNVRRIPFPLVFALLCLLGAGIVLFTAHDYFLYRGKTAARIVEVAEIPDHIEYSDTGEREEICYLQTITARILHGVRKGEEITLTNLRTESNVFDTRYRVGDVLFVQMEDTGDWSVDTVKRDTYLVGLLVCILLILILVGRKKGALAILSVVVNAIIFYLGVLAYVKAGVNLLLVCIAAAVLFTVICLTLIGGVTRMTAISVIATLMGTAVTFGLACAVLYGFRFQGAKVWLIEFLVITQDYKVTFMSELLIGGLGATMDIAMSISSALCELKEKDPDIPFAMLLRSGREIGRDIMGTMTNVLLFTYLCGGIPLMLVAVRSGMTVADYLLVYNNLELLRFLVGSIGIVATVPVSVFVAASLLSPERKAVRQR